MVLTGFASANVWTAAGIESVGTNADDANVSGKRMVKPIACADSGDDEVSPIQAKIHDDAKPKPSIRTKPRMTS
jgi:hypothetical protein